MRVINFRIIIIIDPSSGLATICMGRKLGELCPFGAVRWVPNNTICPGPTPTSTRSGILIHPAVWPQYTNITNRTDRQRSDNIGRTVSETVAQNTNFSCPGYTADTDSINSFKSLLDKFWLDQPIMLDWIADLTRISSQSFKCNIKVN